MVKTWQQMSTVENLVQTNKHGSYFSKSPDVSLDLNQDKAKGLREEYFSFCKHTSEAVQILVVRLTRRLKIPHD